MGIVWTRGCGGVHSGELAVVGYGGESDEVGMMKGWYGIRGMVGKH